VSTPQGPPELPHQEMNLADDPDPAEAIPSSRGERVWTYRRRDPTEMWIRVAWDKIQFIFGVATVNGSSVHEAVGYFVVLFSAVGTGSAAAGLCVFTRAPSYITIPVSLLVTTVTAGFGIRQLNKRPPQVRRHRRRKM
jgi:hypothetical protein